MYNVIFYDKTKDVTQTEQVIERTYNDDGTYDDVITTTEVTKTYRVPTKFVFDTATNTDKLLYNVKVIDDIACSMPSDCSAVKMFANSSITTFSGEEGGLANFDSLTCADEMFSDCESLTTIQISANSLKSASDFVNGCNALTSFSGSLNALEDGTEMFINLTSLTEFDVKLNSLTNGTLMFSGSGITEFKNELPSLTNGEGMFSYTPINNVMMNLPHLLNGIGMFESCEGLSVITLDAPIIRIADNMFINTQIVSVEFNFPKLVSAVGMFDGVTTLVSFSGDICSLEDGTGMFRGTSLETFDVKSLDKLRVADEMMVGTQINEWNLEMPSLKSAVNMFTSIESDEETINPALVSFNSDLSSLEDGTGMFRDCVNLEHFNAPLSSLKTGLDMFTNCKLDAESLLFIIGSLPVLDIENSGDLTIGLNCTSSEVDDFVASTGVYGNYDELYYQVYYNGWNLKLNFNKVEEEET